MDNNDKFGYDEMKDILDKSALEDEQMQKELDNAYDKWAYNNIRVETKKEKDEMLNDLKNKYDKEHVDIYSMLDSVKDRETRERQEEENRRLDQEREEIESQINNRNIDFFNELHTQYVEIKKQQTKTSPKEVEQKQKEKTHEIARKIATALLAGSIAISVVMGGASIIKHPEPPVPEQTPQSIELEENIENSQNFEEVIDAINENKEQQIESGIKIHQEHVIDDRNQKIEEAKEEKEQNEERMQELREKAVEKSNMSDSMKNFVEEVNRQKVIKIESGIKMHPENVADNNETVGGRGL